MTCTSTYNTLNIYIACLCQTYYYKQSDRCILQAILKKKTLTTPFHWFLVCDKIMDMW